MKNLRFVLIIVIILPNFLFGQESQEFIVQGDEISGLTPEREQRMKKAMDIFAKVMNDEDFQKEVSEFIYQYDVPNDVNRNLTPAQVAVKIYEAKEFYKEGKDNIANIHWFIEKKKKPLFSRHPARGYGLPNGIQIYTYTWFFDSADLSEITGHIAHEWSHKVGFDHLFDPHPGRENTVPYAFGDLVAEYAKKYTRTD